MKEDYLNATTKGDEKIECPAPCSFTVKSHDEKEIIELARQHAEKKYNMKISKTELKGMIRPAWLCSKE